MLSDDSLNFSWSEEKSLARIEVGEYPNQTFGGEVVVKDIEGNVLRVDEPNNVHVDKPNERAKLGQKNGDSTIRGKRLG